MTVLPLYDETPQGVHVISYSELDTYRQCPFKHFLGYKERWSKPPYEFSPSGKGTGYHSVMETHYKVIQACQGQGYDSARVLALAKDAVESLLVRWEMNGDHSHEFCELMRWMYYGYVQVYGCDENWEILTVEKTMIVPLLNEDGSPSEFALKAKLDVVVKTRDRGRIFVVDHKSSQSKPKATNTFEFEEQFKLYTFILRKIGKRVHGAIHDFALTKQNEGDKYKPGDAGYKGNMKASNLDARFKRTYIGHTDDDELRMIARETLATARSMYGAENQHERHPDQDKCQWRCDYTEACMSGRRRNDNRLTIEALEDSGFHQDFMRH